MTHWLRHEQRGSAKVHSSRTGDEIPAVAELTSEISYGIGKVL